MKVSISEAIKQIRDELRVAILEGRDQDIVFTPNEIELQLGVCFSVEATAGGGFKLFALLDLSAEGKAARENQHSITLSLSVADRDGKPIKVRSDAVPEGLPE